MLDISSQERLPRTKYSQRRRHPCSVRCARSEEECPSRSALLRARRETRRRSRLPNTWPWLKAGKHKASAN